MGKPKQRKVSVLDRGDSLSIAESLQGKIGRVESSKKEEEKTKSDKKEIELGLDISTSVVGIVGLNIDGTFEFMDHVKFGSKQDTLWLKADEMEMKLKEIQKTYSVKRIFVEASAKAFTPGFSSADTLFTLAKFNGIVSYISTRVFNSPVYDINVSSARKAAGIKVNRKDKTRSTKEQVFDIVREAYPHFPWLTHVAKNGKSKGQTVFSKENYDRCDAWVICRGGQLTTPSN
jgi:hypothetical protein